MIYLKEANVEDAEKEYQFIKDIPEYENGFENKYYGCSIDNPTLLKVQLNNQVYIYHSDEKEHYTRIKMRR